MSLQNLYDSFPFLRYLQTVMKPISTAIVIALLVSSCSLFKKNEPISGTNNPELKELLKTAQKKLTMAKLDPSKIETLEEAKAASEKAVKLLEGESANVKYEAYFNQAEASRFLLQYHLDAKDINKETLGIAGLTGYATISYESYLESLRQTDKKYLRLESHKGVQSLQTQLNRAIFYASELASYSEQYEFGDLFLRAHDLLSIHDRSLYDEESLLPIKYATAVAGNQVGMRVQGLVEDLYKAKYQEPFIYLMRAQYARVEGNHIGELSRIRDGRELFPDDIELIFAELNYHLRNKNDEKVLPLVKEALAKEPENTGLLTTAGDEYAKKATASRAQGENETSEAHFKTSLGYYQKVLTIDPDDVIALGGIAALYYNRAADNSLELNKISADYSREGIAKYNALYQMVKDDFQRALPYFQQVEARDANNITALIALKQIYGTLEDMEKFKVFKGRLERVRNGGQNSSSYFKK